MKRLYYALTLTRAEQEAIDREIDRLEKSAESLKRVPSFSLHMTLAFLGEVDEELIPALLKIKREISFVPFSFKLDHLSYFPDRKNSRLYYLGVNDQEKIADIQKDLRERLYDQKIAFHDKPFLPHVTLSRKTVLRDEPHLLLPITIKAERIYLLESVPYKNTRIGIEVEDRYE